MTTSIIHINTGPQTGKTMLAIGMLKEMQANGANVLYVAPTQKMAEFVRKVRRPAVPIWHAAMIRTWSFDPAITFVVLDDVETIGLDEDGERIYNDDTTEFIHTAKSRMLLHRCPTQLIIIHREH